MCQKHGAGCKSSIQGIATLIRQQVSLKTASDGTNADNIKNARFAKDPNQLKNVTAKILVQARRPRSRTSPLVLEALARSLLAGREHDLELSG